MAKDATVTVKNVSQDVQMFTGHTPFQPGEVRTVSAEDGELLLRSPFMEETTEKAKVMKAVEVPANKTTRGVEA